MKQELVLVTGAAGFIGYHLSLRLLQSGFQVVGVDNLNDYYDVNLKHSRLAELEKFSGFEFRVGDIADRQTLDAWFNELTPELVVHLAAQAGVRYSLENPSAYIESNLVGFANILEACRSISVRHLLYASSSSVYGGNKKSPFSEQHRVDHPVSLYAATKRSNELMADTYAHLYGIPATGLRFFTVYGPYGRPDMAYFSFTDRYFNDQAINVYNNGDSVNDLIRDFTYVDDVVESLMRLLDIPPGSGRPHRILNVGGSRPEKLTYFISTLESALSSSLRRPVRFEKNFEPIKPGDVPATYADATALESITSFKPRIDLQEGLSRFTDWYVEYYSKRP